ncbi:MAG TPA: hypothetical protein VK453_06235 [Micromonosporaceae bacterium]|nr:hypothetical protein [Micromonosporaceae bacterium]
MLLRRWAIVAVAVPLAAAGARRLSDAIETRRGPSRATGILRGSADFLQRHGGRSSSRPRRRWR